MKRGIPERGDVLDILHIDLEPTQGREQQGKRYMLCSWYRDRLISSVCARMGSSIAGLQSRLQETELCGHGTGVPHQPSSRVCPRTRFAVSLSGAGVRTQGLVLCHQSRTLDFRERGATWVESLPATVMEEVLARVRALLDPQPPHRRRCCRTGNGVGEYRGPCTSASASNAALTFDKAAPS